MGLERGVPYRFEGGGYLEEWADQLTFTLERAYFLGERPWSDRIYVLDAPTGRVYRMTQEGWFCSLVTSGGQLIKRERCRYTSAEEEARWG